MANTTTKILIGLCTYKRPKMLVKCIAKLDTLNLDGISVTLLVVNNDSIPLAESITSITAQNIDLIFTQSKERGIPQARNHVLDYACLYNFPLCAFLDDDEEPHPDWIIQLLSTQIKHQADVVQGEVINVYESKPWLFKPLLTDKKFNNSSAHKPVLISTCNVLVSEKLYAKESYNMRFDTGFALTGGSDKDFFHRAIKQHSITTAFSPNALVDEFLDKERTSIKWFFKRYSRLETNNFQRRLKKMSHIRCSIYTLFKILMLGVKGLILLVFLTLPAVFYPPLLRRVLIDTLKISARCHGASFAIIKAPTQAYAFTTGN